MKRYLLYCKWALLILYHLSIEAKRPSQLLKEIQGINEKILFDRLNSLVNAGLIERKSNNKYPLIVYYEIKKNNLMNSFINFIRNINYDINDFIFIIAKIAKKGTFDIMNLLSIENTPRNILEQINGISKRSVFEILKNLEKIGYVKRNVIASKPLRINYKLTEEGEKALSIFKELNNIILSIKSIHNHLP